MHLFLEFRAHLECWDEAFLEWHWISRAGVPCHARLPALYAEYTKSTEFDSVSIRKCIDDAEEESIYNRLCLELGKPCLTGDLIDDIGFRDVQPGLFEQDTIVTALPRTLLGVAI